MASWLTFRSGLRSRWLLWLGLALLVGTTAGGVMAGFAGARRMASVHDRFLDQHRAYDVLVAIDCRPSGLSLTSCLDEIRRLPSVADLTLVENFAGVITTADGRSVQPFAGVDPCSLVAGSVQLFGDRSGRFGVELNEIQIVAGRRADPAAADEVVISKSIADRVGLAPGSVLQLSLFARADCQSDPSEWQAPVSLRVVGIGLAPGEVPPSSGDYLPTIHLTPAFVVAQAPFLPAPGAASLIPVRLSAGVDIAALEADIAGTGARVEVVVNLNDLGEPVERGIRVQAVALALGAGLVALTGGAVLGQVLVRQSHTETADRRVLAALGMSGRARFAVAILPASFLAVLAGGIAALVAGAASPLAPFGRARELEPDGGLWVDAVVIAAGFLVTVAFVMSVMAVMAWRLSRETSASNGATRRRRVAVVDGVASAGFPPTLVSGFRMALERHGGRGTVPAGTSVGVMALAVIAIVGSLTFGAGLTHLLDTPRLTGINWDVFVPYPTRSGLDGASVRIERSRIEAVLAEHPGVSAFAAGTIYPTFPEGRPLELGPQRLSVYMMSFAGGSELGPSLIRGRVPTAIDEMLVGPETLDDLGLALGDTVDVYGQAGTWEDPGEETSMRVRIVGIGVIPMAVGEARLGRGATLTLDGVTRLNPQAEAHGYWLRLAEGSDASVVVADLIDELGASAGDDPGYFDRPAFDEFAAVRDIDQVDRAPQLFATVMGVMALGVIVHVLASGLRANRRDLAVVRALGFRRRDVGRAVAWQSIIYMLAGLAVGMPIGMVVGRLSSRLYAERLGVVPEPMVPWPQLGLVAASALTLAAIIGLVLSRSTTSMSPAMTLRTE